MKLLIAGGRDLDHAGDLASEIEKVTAGVLINRYYIDELE